MTVSGALGLVISGSLLDGAHADTPAAWENAPGVSGFQFLLVLGLLPLTLAAVIALLVYLPMLVSGDKGYRAGQAWRGESEWFGGPRKGVAAADEVTPEQLESGSAATGSASGRW